MTLELTVDNAADYLRERGVAPTRGRVEVEALSGGISNIVLRAAWSGTAVVVKQSLPELRVPERWEFDQARIYAERDCMDVLGRLLPRGSVPSVVFSDDERFIFGMTSAPAGGVNYKDALLRGDIDPRAARWAGELLGRLQREASEDAAVRERFADVGPLIQGRVDPYHRTAMAAHPELAEPIAAEVARLLNTRRTLVLGDYSPKNILVYPERLVLLDFEVAHWGDPAFDPAFLLTHFVLKACRRPELAPRYLGAAGTFWATYRDAAGALAGAPGAVVRELGCLLLSRVDGKSRAEYLTRPAQRDWVRGAAAELIAGDEDDVERALASTAASLGALARPER